MSDWVGRSERPDANGVDAEWRLRHQVATTGRNRTREETTTGRTSGSPRGRLATDTRTRLHRMETSEELAIDELAEATWNLPLGRGIGAGRRGRKRGKHRPPGRRGQATGPGDRPHDREVSPPLPVRGRTIVKPPSEGGDAPDEGATAAGYGDTGELTAMSAPFCRCPAFAALRRFLPIWKNLEICSAASDVVCEWAVIGSRTNSCLGFHRGDLFR